MVLRTPSLRLGIEEEYLLVDPASGDLVTEQAPAFMPACRERLGEQVTHELLQGQVEVGSRICPDVGAARAELFRLRRTVAEIAGGHGMAIWPRRRIPPRSGPTNAAPTSCVTRRSPTTSSCS